MDGQIMNGDMARGIIVIHENLKKIFRPGGPCILTLNSMGETMDRRRRLIYQEVLRRAFCDRCQTKDFDDRCFTKDAWRGMLSEWHSLKDMHPKDFYWWSFIINIRVHCNFSLSIFSLENLRERLRNRLWVVHSHSSFFLFSSWEKLCIRSIKVAIKEDFIICAISFTSSIKNKNKCS